VAKVDKEDKIDPPIQTENFLSYGALIVTAIFAGASVFSSLPSLLAIPGYIVVPPAKTICPNRSFLTSVSHFIIL